MRSNGYRFPCIKCKNITGHKSGVCEVCRKQTGEKVVQVKNLEYPRSRGRPKKADPIVAPL